MKKNYGICGIGAVLFVAILIFFVQQPPLEAERSVGLDTHGTVLRGQRVVPYTTLADVPVSFEDMLLYREDRRFFRHQGIDVRALVRATRNNIQHPTRLQGASTIDQQLVKLQQGAYQRSLRQKAKELLAALRLNLWYTKEEILLAYINALPFPFQTQGLQAGCELLFDRPCDQLRPSEQLFVLATTQLGKNPFTQQGFTQIKGRSGPLCRFLSSGTDLLTGGVSCETIQQQSPVTVSDLVGRQPNEMLHVTEWFEKHIGDESGSVQTDFDIAVRQQIQARIDASATQRRSVDARDCCVMVLDTEGDVVSMNLCREWSEPEAGMVNGCLAKRQTGSAIKPFLYLYAMRALGLSPDDTVLDEPVTFQLENGQVYEPENFDLTYHGEVTLTQALGSSLNIPAVKLLHQAGAAGFVSFLEMLREQAGEPKEVIQEDAKTFTFENNGLSLALGTYELSPLEFARLRTIRLHDDLGSYQEDAEEVIDMLMSSSARVLSFGQDAIIDLPGRAVKTGTSRHFVDGWTCGFKAESRKQKVKSEEKNYMICVRMGNYDGSPMKEGGSLSAGYLRRLVAEKLDSRN